MIHVVRMGEDGVGVTIDEHDGVRILFGTSCSSHVPDGINSTIELDFGEARYLAEVILHELNKAVS